ncbi:MAG: VOC family protein [Dehalococcoidia bacterium]
MTSYDAPRPALIPEFTVTDVEQAVRFYIDILGFAVLYERPEERFAYLVRGRAHLMLEQHGGRSFHEAPMDHPYGRGMHLQIEVPEVSTLWNAVQASGAPVVLPIEDRWYRHDDHDVGHRQFVTRDPDGYLLRFFENLGQRAAQ